MATITLKPALLLRPTELKVKITVILGSEDWLNWEPQSVVAELADNGVKLSDAMADMLSAILTVYQTERPKFELLVFNAVAWGFSGFGVPDQTFELEPPPYYTLPAIFTELKRIDPDTPDDGVWTPQHGDIKRYLYDYLMTPSTEKYPHRPVLLLHPSMAFLKPYYEEHIKPEYMSIIKHAAGKLQSCFKRFNATRLLTDPRLVDECFAKNTTLVKEQIAQYLMALRWMLLKGHPIEDYTAPLVF